MQKKGKRHTMMYKADKFVFYDYISLNNAERKSGPYSK